MAYLTKILFSVVISAAFGQRRRQPFADQANEYGMMMNGMDPMHSGYGMDEEEMSKIKGVCQS